jgi:hypothetical protein
MSSKSVTPAWLVHSFSSGASWAFNALTHDSAAVAHKRMPNPWLVLLSSSFFALLIGVLHRFPRRVGLSRQVLFSKEGPLEHFTFLADFAAAAFMAIAARRVWLRTTDVSRPLLAIAYATLAGLLFLVGMEEIGWGQQVLHFRTPKDWAEINYQQETTLHNLLDAEGVKALGGYIKYLFVAVAIALTVLGVTSDKEFIQAIAPHPSLLPLTCAIAFSGLLHGEVTEAFIALYFLYYSYRVFRLSGGDHRVRSVI